MRIDDNETLSHFPVPLQNNKNHPDNLNHTLSKDSASKA